jgi:DNA modification methylase
MTNHPIREVERLPLNPKKEEVFSIQNEDVAYLTHNLFKYPCKFIPQIPKWAIGKYLKEPNALVYDPFAGSGTTLVEAVLAGHRAGGSDIDPFGRLLSTVKISPFSKSEIQLAEVLLEKFAKGRMLKSDQNWIPNFPNMDHFFSSSAKNELAYLVRQIDGISNRKVKSLFRVVLASILRKVSNADDASPKPYVSTRVSKKTLSPRAAFTKKAAQSIQRVEAFSKLNLGSFTPLSKDARKSKLQDSSVDLIVTSPPYINAFDYVRSLKFENYWLGLVRDSDLERIRRENIGTESVGPITMIDFKAIPEIEEILREIWDLDKRRATVVLRFFEAMMQNFLEMKRILKTGGKYVLVIADSQIRGVHVESAELLSNIAKRLGFKVETKFGYVIRNRYLRIPRSGQGGFMKVDWVVVLEKR